MRCIRFSPTCNFTGKIRQIILVNTICKITFEVLNTSGHRADNKVVSFVFITKMQV